MLKKFVEINADNCPSENPYAVRTYMGDPVTTEWKVENCPPRERVCQKKPPNSTISQVLTIEDELRRLHQKAEESRFIRPFKKRCQLYDEFTMCVIPQRTPDELKVNAEMRERILLGKLDAGLVEHDARLDRTCPKDLVALNSPMNLAEEEEEEEGEEEDAEVKPQLATPECSSNMIIIPDKRMLQLKRPKSRIYLNETQVGPLEELPFPSYNPRVIQEGLEGENLRTYDIIEGCSPQDLWTWNVGLQRREIEMDQDFITAALPKYSYEGELTVYNIPTQLEKTFAAEIVFGGRNIYPEPKQDSNRQRYYYRPSEIAAIIIAFVETYHLNPDFWTAGTMDSILKRGVKLTQRSVQLNYKSEVNDFDILPQVMDRQAAVTIKLHFSGLMKNEPNIYKALSLFFSKYNACILTSPTKDLFLLIWKRCQNSFYIFDPNGRNDLCQRDFEEGKCSLMATRYIEHLVHLIQTFSDLEPADEFNIYEIAMSQYGKLKEPPIKKDDNFAYHKLWAVVNEYYAVKTGGNGGIQQPISGKEKNASLVVSLIALIYAEFELAKLWSPMTIDDILRYGVAYYKTLRKKFRLDGKRWKNKKPELNVVDLPEMFLMGAFKATVRKRPFLLTGHVTDCKNYLESQLVQALHQLFQIPEWPAALLQIDNSVMGIWRDREFFYVFDPFRRNRVGMVVDPDDYRIKGLAVLQMHTTFDSLCRFLYQNALKMRRGGKFFIHGIRTGCIRPLQVMTQTTNKFPALQMGLPTFTDEPEEPALAQKKSIESIPEEERVPAKDEKEWIEELILGIISGIIKSLPEPMLDRPQLYRPGMKVLLRSDKENLRALRLKIKRGYELGEEEQEDLKRVLTIEEELALKSNYAMLHDGAYIIMGRTKLPMLDAEMTKLGGLLAALVATAVSAKYKVSTWNADLVEFCLDAVNEFGENYQNYEYMLACLLAKKLPDIAVGSSNFSLVVPEVYKSSVTKTLRQDLLELLINNNRVLLVCQHFSCAIFKRYNLLYMFIGFACTSIGYRKGSPGPACMMRFVELDSLIRRIEFGCNPQGCAVMNYIVASVQIVDNNLDGRFRRWGKDDEDNEFKAESAYKKKLREKQLEKMQFIDAELNKENKRIQAFLKAKKEHEDRKKGKKAKKGKPEYKDTGLDEGRGEHEEEELGMDEEEGEGEEEIELQHKPGKRLPKEVRIPYKPRPILYGYRMREKDCNFKIQGSLNLDGRNDGSFKEIKPCYFAAALAVLSCSLRPLNRWNSYRIDRVITNAKTIASRVCDLESVFERVVRHVSIDDYEFDIWIRIFEPMGMWVPKAKPAQLTPEAAMTIFKKKLSKTLAERKYLMIFTPNGCFALYHDEFYHLFDAYATMEKAGDAEEQDAEEEQEKQKCPRGPKRYPERNTASWVLFADVESMLKYIDERVSQSDWRQANQYKFYVVDVLSFKKAAPNERILRLLTDLSVPMTCSNKHYGRPEYEICATNESLGWLELENCLPVWSRLNRRNTSGKYRNMPLSKLKKFDVEIDGRLWSLWGNLHPEAPCFDDTVRGRQYLAIYVIACCAASVYNLMDWSAQMLDTIVVNGNKYFQDSAEQIKKEDYEFSLENLNIDCALETLNFVVHIEHVCYGKLYRVPTFNRMNLSEALIYFFSHYQYGIVMVRKRALAIGFCPGHNGGYFMYDCQEKDHPLFPKQQGASYMLRTRHLQVLLYCIVVTLNVPFYNIDFSIHKVEMLREGVTLEEQEEEGEDEGNQTGG